MAIKHFIYFLGERHFHVLTDNKHLTCTLFSHLNHPSLQQVQHVDFIGQFTTYQCPNIRSSGNIVTDTLHVENASIVNYWELVLAQFEKPPLSKLQDDFSLLLESVPFLFVGHCNMDVGCL